MVTMFWTLFLFFLSPLTSMGNVLPGCEFPGEWNGTWFLQNEPDSLEITKEDLGFKGLCFKKETDEKFILHDREQRCYKCVVILDRHANALQLKEGPCQQSSEERLDNLLSELCEQIPSDEPFQTMVRISGEDIECPFNGEFAFSYTTGQQTCKNSQSRMVQCMNPSQVAFNFQACPDGQTQSKGWSKMP